MFKYHATFELKTLKTPACIVYPPQYQCILEYYSVIESSHGTRSSILGPVA